MALGPGQYDEACTAAREATEAEGCLLIIIAGKHGNGFSAQFRGDTLPEAIGNVPRILRTIADQMEADYRRGLI